MKLEILIFLSVIQIFTACGYATSALAAEPPTPTFETSMPPTAPTPEISPAKEWSSFDQAFHDGIESYREKKYDPALLAFTAAIEKEPENISALTNLALVQFQLGHKGFALAYLRKALTLDPHFPSAKAAFEFILPQLDVREIPHEIELWEILRSSVIVPFSMTCFLALTALTFFSTGWLFLIYFGRRKKSLQEEKMPPGFPLIPSLICLIFLAMISLTAMKVIDQSTVRGTITQEKISVLSAPNPQGTSLFDLYPGLEVVVRSQHQDWVQVTYGGAMTGWIPQSAILQTSGRPLW